MQIQSIIACLAAGMIIARLAAELWLSSLNRRHVLAHAGAVPPVFQGVVDEPAYKRSIAYTLAKERFGIVESIYNTAVLLAVLFSGVLPWAYRFWSRAWGDSAWAMAAFLFLVGLCLSLLDLPFAWISQFRLEQKFGFNTTTQKTWWLDRLKVLLLSCILAWPLLALILNMTDWTGHWWWLLDWAAVVAVQLLLSVLAPVIILPLFNKLTPLPEGNLRDNLLELARRTQFHARGIQVMDGSKRSRHSNAFFTGFGRFRKIVLFDTLISHLSEPELEAVVAHEIGHYKKGHIPKMLAVSSFGMLVAFYLISILARQEWFYRAFGFEPGNIAPALLVCGLLSGAAGFWISPLWHWGSRRYEYEADAFAARATGQTQSLVSALRKLHGENLSNLTPHPLYSGFYYSHPTLLEREQALGNTT